MSIKGYTNYTFHEYRINKLISKGLGKKLPVKKTTEIFLQQMREQIGTLGGIEPFTMAFERAWQASERHAIFIENTAIYNNLINGKFDVTDLSQLKFPFDHALIHFPRDLTLDCAGRKTVPPALLVSLTTTSERQAICRRLYGKSMTRYVDESNEPMLSLFYVDPFDVPISGEANVIRSSLRMPLSDLHNCLESPIDYLRDLHEREMAITPAGHAEINKRMESPDLHLQAAYLKLVASMLVYVNAKPSALRDGLPDGVKAAQITPNKALQPSGGLVFGDDVLRGDRGVHFRRWHLRQLWAERYYQGEHKDKSTGSRIVFVKAAMVGDAKPKTLA